MPSLDFILGTAQFGMNYGITNRRGQLTPHDIDQILNFAFQNGITTLDTSLLYGDSLNRISEFLQKNSKIKFRIINKFSIKSDLEETYNQLKKFLTDSKTDSFEALLIHDPSAQIQSKQDLESFFQKVVKNGIARSIGCSIYNMDDFNSMNSIHPMNIVQCPANPFQTKLINDPNLKGVTIHARSLFLQGVLLENKTPEKLSALNPYLDHYRRILDEAYASPLEGLLYWAMNQQRVSEWVIGVTSQRELEDILQQRDHCLKNAKNIDFSSLTKYDDPLLNPVNWPK